MIEATVSCGECETELSEAANVPYEDRQPCPNCGSLMRRKTVTLYEQLSFRSALTGKGKRPGFKSGGKKKPIFEIFSGEDQSADGTWALVERVIDRLAKRYHERVVLEDGTVSRDVDEPLSQHSGRGSAKFKRPSVDQA